MSIPPMNVKRWDNIVHMTVVLTDTHACLTCGRNVKFGTYSRNRVTSDAPTCLLCIAKGLYG